MFYDRQTGVKSSTRTYCPLGKQMWSVHSGYLCAWFASSWARVNELFCTKILFMTTKRERQIQGWIQLEEGVKCYTYNLS